ncbi:BnaA05g10250D [Brassica napus]|uniref:BnaA05g10250D protein n=1 Tax=Brassica napus TaxID=3708 RepID=A0A078FXS2_BRANA|nr:BnaA05g10250D [Brassica napus]
MSMFPSFQLLELNIISAQELAPVSRKMKTYAVAWVHSQRKLTTRVDYTGGANPTWNDNRNLHLALVP